MLVALFPLSVKKIVNKSFVFLGIEKDYDKNSWLSLDCRLDHKLLFGPPCIIEVYRLKNCFESHLISKLH